MNTQGNVIDLNSARDGRRGSPQDPSMLVLRGDYDAANASALWASILELILRDGRDIELDLQEVTFMDASSIRVILWARQALEMQSHRLILSRPSDCVSRLFQMCGLRSLLG